MSTNLNNLKLTDLIFLAQNVTYNQPDKEYKDWTEDEILFNAVYLGVRNQSQIDTLFMACQTCPPVKLLAKERIRRFVTTYMK